MALGNLLGGFFKEALTEGAFFVLLTKSWDFAKSLFDSVAKDEFKKLIINPRGWADEHYFARDLQEANLTPIQRKMIRDGVLLAEEYDKENDTKSARNFRIIVTLKDEGVVSPNVRPGIGILEKVGTMCGSKEEVFATIEAMGAMHDPLMSADKFLHLGKTVILPFLLRKAGNVIASVNCTLISAETAVQKRNDDFAARPLWKKLFLN